MPIKPENRKYYKGEEWKSIRNEILERDKNKCKYCDLPNHIWVIRFKGSGVELLEKIFNLDQAYAEANRRYPDLFSYSCDEDLKGNKDAHLVYIVLTIAHLDHDPTNNGTPGDRTNLAALCQKCHNRHDVEQRKVTRVKTNDEKRGQQRFGE